MVFKNFAAVPLAILRQSAALSYTNFGRVFAITLITQVPALISFFLYGTVFLIDVPDRHPSLNFGLNHDLSARDFLPAISIDIPDDWAHVAQYVVGLMSLAWSYGAIAIGVTTALSENRPVPVISSIQMSLGRILQSSLSLFVTDRKSVV